ARFDLSVPKFLYQAKQGWSGAVEGAAIVKHHTFTFGLVSDGDELAERYSGVTARYQNSQLGTDKVRFSFEYGTYHDEWNASTLDALRFAEETASLPRSLATDTYRSRQYFEPVVTFQVAKPISVSVGASLESFQD